MHVTLQRVRVSNGVVMGSLTVADGFKLVYSCFTIERLDKLIAAGNYTLKWTESPRFTKAAREKARKEGKSEAEVEAIKIETPEITVVPKRSGLRIHVGNFSKQSEGCVLPCTAFSDLNADGKVDGASSQKAYDGLKAALERGGLKDSPCPIIIRDVKG